MGAVHFSLDLELVRWFQRELGLKFFVETGTFRGDTLDSVREIFQELHSVELSEELHRAAKQRFYGVENIHLHQGDSARSLRTIREAVLSSGGKGLFYWLDAHWCVADHTSGEISQCPLLEELQAVQPLTTHDVVLVDDARLFLAPPPPPHEISDWPDLDQILHALQPSTETHFLMVLNDVIIFAPRTLQKKFKTFAAGLQKDILHTFQQAKEQERWKELHDQAKAYAARLEEKTANYMDLCEQLTTLHKLLDRVEMKAARRISELLRGRPTR
jgi:hypothetical protein